MSASSSRQRAQLFLSSIRHKEELGRGTASGVGTPEFTLPLSVSLFGHLCDVESGYTTADPAFSQVKRGLTPISAGCQGSHEDRMGPHRVWHKQLFTNH